MNTITAMTWTLASKSAELKVHTCKRAGWDFVIRTPHTGLVTLLALHRDGRRSETRHVTLPAAKAEAIALMHPSEAMGWPEFRDSGSRSSDYRARWDDESFRVYRDGDGAWWYEEGAAAPRRVEGLWDARQRAAQRLIEVHGPVTARNASRVVDEPTQLLEAALRAAGIRFTPKQLSVAALALNS